MTSLHQARPGLPLRAPQQDRAIVAQPPLARVDGLLAANRARLAHVPLDVLGRSWSDLERAARASLLAEANAYLRQAGEPIPSGESTSILMAGHQPEWFHPGVWIKNFALQGLARAHSVTAVNLIVDNDTVKKTSLRLPVLPAEAGDWPHLGTVPFDHWNGEIPYEEATVRDETLFATFADRVRTVVKGYGFAPLLDVLWPEVRRQAERTPLLGERFAAARRALERAWGCHNFEVPVSRLCRTEPFAWFACHLLVNLPRFHSLYNATVHEHRRLHGIRSRNHPVPDLAAEDDWLEIPFWAWHPGQPRRGRLLVRLTNEAAELRVGNERGPVLPLGTAHNRQPLLAAWRDLERQGFKIRSRALTNTLYARLFLADLFIHGIGGGKYDELTDTLVRRFYGFEPPGFLVLSGTLRLPLPAYPVTAEDRHRLARQLRDLGHNPQRHLADGALADPAFRPLAEQKQALIAQEPTTPSAKRARFRELRRLTELLYPSVADQARRVEEELAHSEHALRANAILQRRDYAFCLFPETVLRPFCTQFL